MKENSLSRTKYRGVTFSTVGLFNLDVFNPYRTQITCIINNGFISHSSSKHHESHLICLTSGGYYIYPSK
ncbi:hypothetical protein V6Z11_D09G103700 [Gossypium hirsutum]